jgi:hypothetical protein
MIDKVTCGIDGLRKDPDSDEVMQYRLDLMIYSHEEGFLRNAMPKVIAAVGKALEQVQEDYR